MKKRLALCLLACSMLAMSSSFMAEEVATEAVTEAITEEETEAEETAVVPQGVYTQIGAMDQFGNLQDLMDSLAATETLSFNPNGTFKHGAIISSWSEDVLWYEDQYHFEKDETAEKPSFLKNREASAYKLVVEADGQSQEYQIWVTSDWIFLGDDFVMTENEGSSDFLVLGREGATEEEWTEFASAVADEKAGKTKQYNSDTIKQVQEALNKSGHECGTADGIAGSKTKEAIKAYQSENSMEADGEIDEELLVSLGIE